MDTEEIRARLVQQDEMLTGTRCRLERLGFTRIEVFYEELVQRQDETIARLLRFLHVDKSAELDSTFTPSPGSIAERIENLEEVRGALAGTRFEWMLGAASRREEPVASSAR